MGKQNLVIRMAAATISDHVAVLMRENPEFKTQD